jgi:hypothetical protein
MRTSPSIVPDPDRDVYLVLDDFGRMGCAWRELKTPILRLSSKICSKRRPCFSRGPQPGGRKPLAHV